MDNKTKKKIINKNKNSQTQNKNNKIKIIAINVNSIISNQRRANLLQIINSSHPDIILIGETKINKKHKLSYIGYEILRTDREGNSNGGGTAIIIKSHIKHRRIYPKCLSNPICLETTVIEIKIKSDQTLYIISAYAAGNCKKEFSIELNALFKELKLDETKNFYIIAGDLNAKHTNWLNLINNSRGKTLQNWIQKNEIKYKIKIIGSNLPTYPRTNAYLDICIADNRLKFTELINNKLETIPYDSDHNAIKINLDLDQHIYNTQENIQEHYNYNKTNWHKFRETCTKKNLEEIQNNRNLSNTEIDNGLEKINSIITEAIKKNTPTNAKFNSSEQYINKKILKLQKFKSLLITRLHKIQNSNDINKTNNIKILKKLIKNTKENLKIEFSKSISKAWEKKIKSIPSKDPTKALPLINKLFRNKGNSSIDNIKIEPNNTDLITQAKLNHTDYQKDNNNNFIITNPVDKLDILGASFEETHTQNSNLGKKSHENIIKITTNNFIKELETDKKNNISITEFSDNNRAHKPETNSIKNYFITHLELATILKKMNNKKSSSFDQIPNIILKQIPAKIIYYYTILFNNALNNKYFPKKWKTAKTIALLKKGKKGENPKSYRPISLLPNISKIFEIIINNSINAHCKKENIIPDHQFGFRHKHSTIHAINKFTSDICWNLNNNQCTGALFIDLEKAFDTVWLEGLLYKLIKNKFPTYLIKIIWNMITDRKFIVTENQLTSKNTYAVKNGLQQGTVNSPILFNIYTCDLLQLYGFNDSNKQKAIAFADDLLVYTSDKKSTKINENLQDLFEKIKNYFHTWKLKINTQKCESILFRPKLANTNSDVIKNWKKFKIKESKNSNIEIPHKRVVKYLGIYMDDHLNFKHHTNTQLEKAKKAYHATTRLFHSKYLDTKIKILCYKLLIRPIITYGCQIWFNIPAHWMEKIRIFERYCLRACLNMYRSPESNYTKHYKNKIILDKANIERIDTHIIKICRNHTAKASTLIINNLINGPYYPQPLYFKKTMETGHTPPEIFHYLDANGYIQNHENIPIIYHITRNSFTHTIKYNANTEHIITKFNTDLSIKDLKYQATKNKKYWWITDQTI